MVLASTDREIVGLVLMLIAVIVVLYALRAFVHWFEEEGSDE